LAVDSRVEGQGLGARLLVEALKQILTASKKLAIIVVLIDAIDEKAKGFYLHFGFIELSGHDLKLFLPFETIDQLFG
ncbi:MAG TPA: GNAT family N-acetyltransferase, partial [Gammaproteobacteria bacterium]|nr:GNAT family N-acetyltransferase [Gammaproteobacteria bacterium]